MSAKARGEDPTPTTRVIIRNLPKYCTEEKLRGFVEASIHAPTTDIRIPKDAKGLSRRIAFVGLRTIGEAAKTIEHLNRTFFDTSRIAVSYAYAPGSSEIPRPWSRHVAGSSAYERAQGKKEALKQKKEAAKASQAPVVPKETTLRETAPSKSEALKVEFLRLERKRKGQTTWMNDDALLSVPEHQKASSSKAGSRKRLKPIRNDASHALQHTRISVTDVCPTKAGVSNTRQHIEYLDDDASDAVSNGDAEAGVTQEDEESTTDDTSTGTRISSPTVNATAVDHKATSNMMPESSTQAVDSQATTVAWASEQDAEEEEDPLTWLRERSSQTCLATAAEPETLNPKANARSSKVPKADEQPNESNEAVKETSEQGADDSCIADTGRLLLLNLAYNMTEEELRAEVARFGEVSELHICRDGPGGKSVGRAFIRYAFPEHAVRAASVLNNALLQGRIIRVRGAHDPPPKLETLPKVQGAKKKATSAYKRQHDAQLKKNADNVRTWNLLYVSANSAVDAVAEALGTDKRDILGIDGTAPNIAGDDSMAARVALGETHVVRETKQWLKAQGIRLEAFERQGETLLLSTLAADANGQTMKRSDDCIIVKHLPTKTTEEDIYRLFSRFGSIVRYCIAPSKTVAVVQFLEPSHAKRAFIQLAYSRFRDTPLYLEWAPVHLFIADKPTQSIMPSDSTVDAGTGSAVDTHTNDPTEQLKTLLDEADTTEASTKTHVSLFVKNLNFETTEIILGNVFKSAPGFVQATIARKKPTQSKRDTTMNSKDASSPPMLSMGYGFVEFKTMEAAREALKRFQGKVIDGHTIEIKISQRVSQPPTTNVTHTEPSDASAEHQCIDLSGVTNKLTIRNLAFEATKKDLRRLFGSFGNVVAVRIPKKADGTSRGYGFVEFLSRAEAIAALESLQHTHLYGRKMVLEPAHEVDVTSASTMRQKQEKTLRHTTEAESRKLKVSLEDSGDTPFSIGVM